MKNRIILRTI